MDSRVSVERLRDGAYRLRDLRLGSVVRWDPQRGPLRNVRFPRSAFKRQALKLGLGPACVGCGYLEFEHNIDGEEKAPCGGFEAPRG